MWSLIGRGIWATCWQWRHYQLTLLLLLLLLIICWRLCHLW
jgi:hypothetical protein